MVISSGLLAMARDGAGQQQPILKRPPDC